MITDQYIINITPAGGNMAALTILNQQGDSLGSKKVDLSESLNSSGETPTQGNSRGPSNHFAPLTPATDYLSLALTAATTVTKLLGCTAGIATAVTGVGVALAAVSCTSLFLDVVVNQLPEDHYLYDELSLASDLTGLGSLPALKALKTVNALTKADEIIEVLGQVVSGTKSAYETGKSKWQEHFSQPIVQTTNEINKPVTTTTSKTSTTTSKTSEKISDDVLLAGLCDSIFPATNCPKRATRFIMFTESNRSGQGLQSLLDSLGAGGWSVSKDVSLLPMYLVVSRDTLSKPAKNEKFGYKIFETGESWDQLADSANALGAKGWKLMVINMMSAIMMRDETNSGKSYPRFEYMKVTGLEDAFSSEKDYNENHSAILSMLNQKGGQGWDFFLIGAEDCIMQRVQNSGIQYEYKFVNMNGVYEVKKLFNNAGSEGWDYCTFPLVAYRASFIPPIIMKRTKENPGQFEYNFKFIPQIDLFSNKSYDRAINAMQKAFRGTMSNGWQFSGVLAIDESFDEFDNKVFFVFKADKGCK
jgi:hypothetical protein